MISIPFFIMAAAQAPPACTLATVNINNWIGVDVLILLATFSVGAVIYALAGLLPNPHREKLKGIVRIEYTEGAFSLVLIASLISLAYAGCNVGFSLSGLSSGNYQNVFQSDQHYIGKLLFVTGGNIAGQLMARDMVLSIDAAFSNEVFYRLSSLLKGSFGVPNPFKLIPYVKNYVSLNETGRLASVYNSYGDTYLLYAGFVVVTFGALFILYFLLPIILALGMNLLVPVAIVLRSISFAGPKFREASNAFIAIGVALYFVLPLAISSNQAIVNWLYCQNQNGASACNPYMQYIEPYTLSNIQATAFLTPQTLQYGTIFGFHFSLPYSLFGQIGASSSGGFWNYALNMLESMVRLPYQVSAYATVVAQYIFQGIVLIAIDFAIAMGLAQGLYKGLNAIPTILGGGGPFWSD